MKGADGFVQVQRAGGGGTELQLIVGQASLTTSNNLMPLIEAIEEQSGQRPTEVLADSGYCSEQNLEKLDSERGPGTSH